MHRTIFKEKQGNSFNDLLVINKCGELYKKFKDSTALLSIYY